ncbi:hypothetical protein KIL84_003969 [Mauremys mutica]|uniref:Uncharacterized protein n=1 Tax=Mauremys mutica TaxID=74926 RepID=A0A9D3WV95_9SAUR|nr:hypothetical protein KIL84_003969 [Mauremys mutica]
MILTARHELSLWSLLRYKAGTFFTGDSKPTPACLTWATQLLPGTGQRQPRAQPPGRSKGGDELGGGCYIKLGWFLLFIITFLCNISPAGWWGSWAVHGEGKKSS